MTDNGLEKINKLILGLILVTVAFNIIFLMRYNFEADAAFYITLAQEQIRTGSLFPDGMYYSTGLFILTPNLLVIPFLFLTNNLVLARQLAILLLWVVVYIVLYKFFVTREERNVPGFIIASGLFSVLYVNSSVVSMHFYQGAYICYLLFQLIFLTFMKRVIIKGYTDRNRLILLCLLYIIANLGDIRNLLIWGIPGLVSYIIYIVLRSGGDFKVLENDTEAKNVIRVLFYSILLAFIFCFVLARAYGTGGSTAGTFLISSKDFGQSFNAIIIGLFSLCGNIPETFFFSGGGFFKLINVLFALILFLLVPSIAVKYLKKFDYKSSKYIILFSLISSLIYFVVVFMTGAAIAEDRYLIPLYNNGILIFAVVLGFYLQKYHTKLLPVVIFSFLVYVLACNSYYLVCQKESLVNKKFGFFAQGIEGVTDFLESKGLYYGYATFFNAETYSVLSNNKVNVRSIRFEKGKIMPDYWLTVKRFYDPVNYNGSSFLMLTHDELKYYFPKGFVGLGLGDPKEVLMFKNYLIYVYGYNIASKFSEGKKLYYLIRGKQTGTYISTQ